MAGEWLLASLNGVYGRCLPSRDSMAEEEAMAEREVEEAVERRVEGAEDDEEDFEVVSGPVDPSLSLDGTQVSMMPNPTIQEQPEGEQKAMGPMETFVLIQKEHEALRSLRNDLLEQQSILTATKTAQAQRNKEMSDMKEQLADAQAELEKQRTENAELREAVKTNSELRMQVDELTARLMMAEETGKYQERMIREFKAEGFVSVQPSMLTDALLAKDIAEKDDKIKSAQKNIESLESALVAEKNRSTEFEKECDQLRNHVAALQVQLADDRSYTEEIQGELNRLRAEKLRSQSDQRNAQPTSSVSNAPTRNFIKGGTERKKTPSQPLRTSVKSKPKLTTPEECRYREFFKKREEGTDWPRRGGRTDWLKEGKPQNSVVREGDGRSADSVFICENCDLRICSEGLFLKHIEVCRPSIDHVD